MILSYQFILFVNYYSRGNFLKRRNYGSKVGGTKYGVRRHSKCQMHVFGGPRVKSWEGRVLSGSHGSCTPSVFLLQLINLHPTLYLIQMDQLLADE